MLGSLTSEVNKRNLRRLKRLCFYQIQSNHNPDLWGCMGSDVCRLLPDLRWWIGKKSLTNAHPCLQCFLTCFQLLMWRLHSRFLTDRFDFPQVKIPLNQFYPYIRCGLCCGFLIDASTITECLHTCEWWTRSALTTNRVPKAQSVRVFGIKSSVSMREQMLQIRDSELSFLANLFTTHYAVQLIWRNKNRCLRWCGWLWSFAVWESMAALWCTDVTIMKIFVLFCVYLYVSL